MGRQRMRQESPATVALAATAGIARGGGAAVPAAAGAAFAARVPAPAGPVIPGTHGVRRP